MRCTALTTQNKRCKNVCVHGKQTCFNHTQFDAFECIICNCEVNNKKQACKLNCGHQFCRSCIKNWIQHDKNTCPICRETISTHLILELVPDFYAQRASVRIPITSNGGWFSIERRLNNRTFIANLIATLEIHAQTLPEE
jgi:hypothetical protein